MPEIEPRVIDPLYPDLRYAVGRWLSNYFDSSSGEPILRPTNRYQGPLFPDVNQTRLPQVWNSWQPWDAGTTALAQFIGGQGAVKPGQRDQNLSQLARWGGGQGPGTQAMSNLMQFGAASEAGRPLANIAQFGVPTQGIANLLAPFLAGQSPSSYRAPTVPQRQVTRTEKRPTS